MIFGLSPNKSGERSTFDYASIDLNKLGLFYAAILCLLAFLVLINFNFFTILLALGSMPLAFTYPLMKRFTYWPQLFLGVTFNYGLILGWTAVKGDLEIVPILFYVVARFPEVTITKFLSPTA